MEKKTGLAPLLCDDPQILILGSLPGDESLRRQEYYGNPRNFFWRILSSVFGDTCPEDYERKKQFLSRHHVILWDVYRDAHRDGSLDANITEGDFNDIAGLLERYPGIRTIGLNGGKAAAAFKKYRRQHSTLRFNPRIRIVELKSSSPMVLSAGWTLDRLIEQWKTLVEK